ncbi:MAG: Thioredoxin family protein [uncultured Sulfurovum sp.]|uniref:Thioredoxin family protein n=1 Tax=uncultured Sulfurovum sp. TaxID=269237 RepID=A0A6S6TXE7_9BACT|nr:MAG: Thioredoxin family protein [uncultured Sulfurovum sp.]
MKLLLLSLFLLTFSACESKTSTKKTTYERNKAYGIPWEKDLDSAFEKAKEEKKILIVMAVSDNCQWCEKMKKNTLSNPKVAKQLKKYVLVMADRETEEERNQFPPFEHVPIIFFMTHEKEIIDDLRGYFEAEDFLEYLNDLG